MSQFQSEVKGHDKKTSEEEPMLDEKKECTTKDRKPKDRISKRSNVKRSKIQMVENQKIENKISKKIETNSRKDRK